MGNDEDGAARFLICFGGTCGFTSSESDVIELLSPDRLPSTFGSMRWPGGEKFEPEVEMRRDENVDPAVGNGEDMDLDTRRDSLPLCILGVGIGGNRVGSIPIDILRGYKCPPCCTR
jgi:hypothetical protein